MLIRPVYVLILTISLSICFCSAAIGADEALLILKSDQFTDTEATIADLDAMGGHAIHVIPPRAVIARVPTEVETRIRDHYNVAALYRDTVPELEGFGTDIASGVSAWNHLIQPHLPAPEHMGRPLAGDVRPKPVYEEMSPQVLGGELMGAPGFYDTSSYMIGKIAVGVILPESNGSGPTNENWDTARQNAVNNEIVAGMQFWHNAGGASAKLTFYYDLRFSVPTQYEPITLINENTWLLDVLANMGYTSGSYPWTRALPYINDIRDTYNTDWCFAIFVVDSLKDSDGAFPNGYFAFAYPGGPLFVMTYDNDGYGIANMDMVSRHETAHIFQAADEYYQPGYATCELNYYGYLNVYNGNCMHPDNPGPFVNCVMRDNSTNICQYTRGQIGWWDSDSDLKFDPVDNVITNTLNSHSSPTREIYATFTGSATDIAYDSPTLPDCTINKIMAVKFRVDGGSWMDAAASDGAFDEYSEGYTFTTPALSEGSHLIETQAFTGYGDTATPNCNASPIASQTIVVQDSDPTPPLMGAVVDEGETASDDTRLAASWSAADPESYVAEYRYAIGTSPTDPGSGYVRDWTSTSSTPSVTATGLSLTVGETYYFYVKAKNVSGIWSSPVASDGITIVELSIGEVKALDPNRWIVLKDKVVTIDSFNPGYNQFYIEEMDQSSAIRVKWGGSIARGSRVTVKGLISAASASTGYEREIQAGSVQTLSTGNTLPNSIGMNTREIGGGALNSYTPGLYGGVGLNNVGMLVRIAGRVNSKGTGYFYVDDGYKRATNTSATGIRVISTYSVSNGDYVVVTGIVVGYVPSGWTEALPAIRTRGTSDVTKL